MGGVALLFSFVLDEGKRGDDDTRSPDLQSALAPNDHYFQSIYFIVFMKKIYFLALIVILQNPAFSQTQFPKHQLSFNGFRNPSIGLEYQRSQVSVHGGYYVTNFTSGVTTEFLKTGFSYWFLPLDDKEIPSSFYVGYSYLRGLTREYKDKNSYAVETGLRWYVLDGLNFRLGVIALETEGGNLKINPTPSVSYSLLF